MSGDLMRRRHATVRLIVCGAVFGVSAGLLAGLGGPTLSSRALAKGNQQKTVWDGVYTKAQADRGEQAYKLSCGYCHRDDLAGGFFDDGTGRAPALAGARAFDSSFEKRWSGQTVSEMLVEIGEKMPLQNPASLTVQAYTDIISYLLAKNDVPAGSQELPADLEALQAIRITGKSGR